MRKREARLWLLSGLEHPLPELQERLFQLGDQGFVLIENGPMLGESGLELIQLGGDFGRILLGTLVVDDSLSEFNHLSRLLGLNLDGMKPEAIVGQHVSSFYWIGGFYYRK